MEIIVWILVSVSAAAVGIAGAFSVDRNRWKKRAENLDKQNDRLADENANLRVGGSSTGDKIDMIACPWCGKDMLYHLSGFHWLVCPDDTCGFTSRKATIGALVSDVASERRKVNAPDDRMSNANSVDSVVETEGEQ